MKIKIGMVSLGCSKNLVDGEIMLGILGSEGYEIVADPKEAQVIIVNTCAFIESAKQEAIDTILEMAAYKARNCRLLVATGCLAERYADEIRESLPEVDVVLGTGDYEKIAAAIKEGLSGKKVTQRCHMDAALLEGAPRLVSTPGYYAFLKIAEGCDNRCTYCVIPSIRGKFRSRRMEDVALEAEALAGAGVKELIVIAQDTTNYGADLYGEPCLDKLLGRLCEIEGLRWIRVHYCYPERITDGLMEAFCHPKVCAYLDLPVQHADNRVLKRMNRPTTREEMEDIICRFRKKVPGVAIRTSIIVGFPGETDEQFETLCDFVRKMEFDRMGVFMYSKEEGTPAAKLGGQIPKKVKQQRHDALMAIQKEIAAGKNRAKIGSEFEVLCEGFEDLFYVGRTQADAPDIDQKVFFAAKREVCPGEFVRVKILEVDDYDLVGEMIDEPGE